VDTDVDQRTAACLLPLREPAAEPEFGRAPKPASLRIVDVPEVAGEDLLLQHETVGPVAVIERDHERLIRVPHDLCREALTVGLRVSEGLFEENVLAGVERVYAIDA
jgi:hypothetical protein